MKCVIQRVKEARVDVDGKTVGQIGQGILVFIGVKKTDGDEQLSYMIEKVAGLRIFEDDQGKMNLSARDVNGEFLVVSQFTILGDCKKGKRPSFDAAADPQKGEDFYNRFVEGLKQRGLKVETGVFRAMMDVSLINDGPVTFILEK